MNEKYLLFCDDKTDFYHLSVLKNIVDTYATINKNGKEYHLIFETIHLEYDDTFVIKINGKKYTLKQYIPLKEKLKIL